MPLNVDDVERFETFRPRLEGIAYRLLGSASEAEDAAQETFLRWQAAEVERIEVPEAWLTKVVTNLCLNQLSSARARRETYVGQWLPEPLLVEDPMLGPTETVEQRESVSYAVLALMERLSPNERAVYVLREAFDYPHREIAEILDITEAASQQLFHRARKHVADGKVRTEIEEGAARRVVEEFLAAATSGRTEPLVRLLTQDVVAIGDGGGKIPARAKAVEGAAAVAKFMRGLFKSGTAKRALVGGSIEVYVTAAAHEVAGRPGALRLQQRLAQLHAGQAVVVVGGGLTGLESAAEIAEARPDLDVALAARGGLGDWLAPKSRRHLRKAFDRLGITVHEHAAVAGVEADHVDTADGRTFPAEAVVWTAGFAVHPIAEATTLELGDAGQIVVDQTMRSVSHPDVYAVGDAALVAGPGDKPLRMSCASGVPTAWQAADAIAARLTGGKLPNVPLRYFNQCILLGRRDGVIQYVTADDRSVRAALTGRIAAVYKELVCKGAAWSVAHPMLGMPSRRRHVVSDQAHIGPTTAEATA